MRFLAVGLTVCLALACQRPAVNTTSDPADVRMRIVTDDLGRRILIPTKIKRAVSTAPSVTENIFAVGAGDRLVGVTTFCNYPEEAKNIAKIGDTMTPNMETIVALKPDVVFVSTASQIETFTKTLEQNGIAVYVTNPKGMHGVVRNLREFAIVFGTEQSSRPAIDELEGRIDRLRELLGTDLREDEEDEAYRKRTASVTTFIQFSREPLFTAGMESYLNEMIEIAGGRSVTANVPTAFPKLSKETASALNPEAIIISESPDNQEPNEVFRNSPAVRNGRVYKINADLLARPGPRLVDALEQIARFLHPEKFRDN